MKSFKFIPPFIRENGKIIVGFIFTVFFLALFIWFIKHEQGELKQVRQLLLRANWVWISWGICLSIVYLFVHGMMYRSAFLTIGSRISVGNGTLLYLKRNFVSIFLPAGGVSSLAFFSGDIEKKGISQSQINFASSIYGFVGILSVVVVAIPVFIYAIFEGSIGNGEGLGLIAVLVLIAAIYGLYRSVISEGKIYRLIIKYVPTIEIYLADFRSNAIERNSFLKTLGYSIFIEVIGIVHIYIAMLALAIESSIINAMVAYIIGVVFLIISPFLRGLGAVEASMTYMLIRLGYSSAEAISITFVYRFMEFWIPMLLGAFSFLLKINKLLMRILPALLLFLMGVVNLISVLTPAIHSRLHFLKDFLPVEAIRVSNYFVFTAGLFLLVTAAFMLKGLRIAWYFALGLCFISLVGHITKAIDYEESCFALLVIVILFISRREYYIKTNPRTRSVGIQAILLSIGAVILYGTIGFYFLDKKHFNIDFSLWQSVRYTMENFILIGSNDLVASDRFARNFLLSINISGFLSIAVLIYTLIRPYIPKSVIEDDELEWASLQLEKHGNSSLDYFKTYGDKLIYRDGDGFLAYRLSRNFAVVLESPVCAPEDSMRLIRSFDKYCEEKGLKNLYYRVSENGSTVFEALNKKKLFLGQEGIVDLETFSLAGGGRKSIRNALKRVSDSGYTSKVYHAPIKDGILQRLKSVSDEWLKDTGRTEIVFSQGMFDWNELKTQTIITVENAEEKIVAFLNLVPDYVEGEATYDLIRKTADAPNGIIDFIMVAMFEHLRLEGFKKVNIGFAPMSGISHAKNIPERSMKFAYERIHAFSRYKGLRDAKDKFSPIWSNKYLIYSQDYDLLQVPAVLNHVIKP
ncbi:phosphatidylglycerol lysyltransferase domain-containing protein [Pedobacter nyackensis]|uniref:phosphatidylglycerol lysyltransferase domain-containing protein n=1 Tax=Pedobacter nyackensis TaxID=475255 RepID=UPI00293141D5|nr:phosphatidylglycerol lysyltransferase domain-containing protein [Pedobacter nyackensis]